MANLLRWTGPVLLLAGVSLLLLTLLRGSASLTLWLVVPVLSGRSPEFLLGALLLVVGVFLLPLLGMGGEAESRQAPDISARAARPRSVGGVVLLGPVPLVFGSWRGAPAWVRWSLVAVGLFSTGLLAAYVLRQL